MPLTRADFTLEFCLALVQQHGNLKDAAMAVVRDPGVESDRYIGKPLDWKTVYAWMSDHVGPRRTGGPRAAQERIEEMRADEQQMPPGIGLAEPLDDEKLNRIAELLAKANINPESIGAIRSARVKSYGVAMKLEERTVDPETGKVRVTQTPHEMGLHATDVTLAPIVPDFPLVVPADPTVVQFVPPPRILRATRSVPVISDAQIGFLRDLETDVLEPTHDPAAMDVAKQIVADIAPDEIVFIGDWADWPTFSRWPQHPEMRRTLQHSINAAHRELAEFVSAAGARCTKRKMIGSNHQARPEKFLLEHNLEAVGIRRADIVGQPPEWPSLSEQFLLRYDELGIDFSGQYPGGEYFLLPDLVLQHAPPRSKEFAASVIHGHTHALTRSTIVQHAHEARNTYFVYDIGCLCQVGSTANKRRLMVTKTPSDRARTTWAQGIGIVSIVEASGSRPATHAVEQVSIIDGQAIVGGKVFRARATVDEAA